MKNLIGWIRQNRLKSAAVAAVALAAVAVAAVLLAGVAGGGRKSYSSAGRMEYVDFIDSSARVKVEGVASAEVDGGVLSKMDLVEVKFTRVDEDGSERELAFKGVPLQKLLAFLGVEYYSYIELYSPDGGKRLASGGLFVVAGPADFPPPEKGTFLYVESEYPKGTWPPKGMWRHDVARIVVRDDGGGLIFVTAVGPQALETASKLAGFEPATIKDLPEGYQLAGVYVEPGRNVVTQVWQKEGAGATVYVYLSQREGEMDEADRRGEPTEISGKPALREAVEAHDGFPPVIVLRWTDGGRFYMLSAALEGGQDEKLICELAGMVG